MDFQERSVGVADDAWFENSLPNKAAICSSDMGDASSEGTMLPKSALLELPPALIAEIFKHLDARELSVVSCVSVLLHRLSSDSNGWKDFYYERWGNPTPSTPKDASHMLSERTWRDLYVAREARSKAFLGRFQTDIMNGHSRAVRCVRFLSPANLIFTAGYDSTIRIWDMEDCLPLTWSRPLGYTLRAMAVDMKILVVGGSDANIRVWKALPGLRHIFDVGGVGVGATEVVLSGHEGPITSLSMDEARVCSGSWDMTVKVWDRNTMTCINTLMHGDWVWAVSLRSQRLVSSAGSDVYTWDVDAGSCLRFRGGAHHGQVYAVECSRSGRYLFSGGEDGAIHMYEDKALRKKGCTELFERSPSNPIARWQPHSGAVYALAFEDPWLVSASGDGSLAMMDIRQISKKCSDEEKLGASSRSGKCKSCAPWALVSTNVEPARRMLFGSKQCFYSVDIGADRIVSAGEEQVVKVWDFSHALEIERRVQALRSVRHKQRLKRKPATHQHNNKQPGDVCSTVAKRDGVIQGPATWQRQGIKMKA